MGLKFNNKNLLHLKKSFSSKTDYNTATSKKLKIQKLTSQSKKILKNLGYQLKQNA